MRQSTTYCWARSYWRVVLVVVAVVVSTNDTSISSSEWLTRTVRPTVESRLEFVFMSVELWCGASGIIGQLVGKLIGGGTCEKCLEFFFQYLFLNICHLQKEKKIIGINRITKKISGLKEKKTLQLYFCNMPEIFF